MTTISIKRTTKMLGDAVVWGRGSLGSDHAK